MSYDCSRRWFKLGSGLGADAKPISEQLRESISTEISRCVLEIVDERVGVFRAKIMVIIGACTLTLREFCACGAHAFHGEREPFDSRRWLADMDDMFRTSFFPEEVKVRYASFL